MAADKLPENTDPYLQRLKKAKENRAVCKIDFAAFASTTPPNAKIFAFEGPADKCVYYYWIKSSHPEVKYEPYVCKNKEKVLELFAILQEDLTGMGERVYYFVDRDFDKIEAHPESDKIFITDRYSIENYIVCPRLLDDVLTIDFHCNGHPEIRKKIIGIFEKNYDEFLAATADINFRLYTARQLKISRTENLPERINEIAHIEIEKNSLKKQPDEIVKLSREPKPEESKELEEEFKKLRPRHHYRGKFSLMFFIKWLNLLREDRASKCSVFFTPLSTPEFSIDSSFRIETLAPKSEPPGSLNNFLSAIS